MKLNQSAHTDCCFRARSQMSTCCRYRFGAKERAAKWRRDAASISFPVVPELLMSKPYQVAAAARRMKRPPYWAERGESCNTTRVWFSAIRLCLVNMLWGLDCFLRLRLSPTRYQALNNSSYSLKWRTRLKLLFQSVWCRHTKKHRFHWFKSGCFTAGWQPGDDQTNSSSQLERSSKKQSFHAVVVS